MASPSFKLQAAYFCNETHLDSTNNTNPRPPRSHTGTPNPPNSTTRLTTPTHRLEVGHVSVVCVAMSTADASSFLPYEEPAIINILIITSFLLLLNIVNYYLNAAINCGLAGQLFLGIFWGAPLGNWLDLYTQEAVVQLGYLGLILLVYEGGLNTSFTPLMDNIFLSGAVALTGIACPIALSFVLMPLVDATALQCFAAGAALSATSLGTTFTMLQTSGLGRTKVGVVLTSAAMMDDVVGLVMVQVVAGLGEGSVGSSVGRPIGASFGLLGFVVLAGWGLWRALGEKEVEFGRAIRWGMHTAVLVALVVIAGYAGASVLFAAFLAGAAVSWWDERAMLEEHMAGVTLYEEYYGAVVARVLQPFFFASIGFSIPITRMFRAEIVWKGVVYAMLMTVGKLLTGVWLSPIPKRRPAPLVEKNLTTKYGPAILGLAMVARGEIAFLIAAVANAKGVYGEELFLIVVWAAVVCTVVGPIGVGVLVRNIKKHDG